MPLDDVVFAVPEMFVAYGVPVAVALIRVVDWPLPIATMPKSRF